MAKTKIVILGGGGGGLSAGWMLSRSKKFDVTLVEKESSPGGLCATFRHGDSLLDYGPHKFYSVVPGIQDEIKALMGPELVTHNKKNSIYLFDSYLNYPLSMLELSMKMGFGNILGAVSSIAAEKFKRRGKVRSYRNYIISRFGSKLYELVFEPLASKTWGDPSTLSEDIARTRIPSKGFIELFLRIAGLKKEDKTTDASRFVYPENGFGRITERMAEEIKNNGGAILTSAAAISVSGKSGTITEALVETGGGLKIIPCDTLISSIPLASFCGMLPAYGGFDPHRSAEITEKLESRTVYMVYLFVDNPGLTRDHWIFFPGREVLFGRVSEQKNFSPKMLKEGKTVICCDFTDNNGGPMSHLGDDDLAVWCLEGLKKVGIIKGQKLEGSLVKRSAGFYPRYDLDYRENLVDLFGMLKSFKNLLLTGRVGFYNYNNLDHCVDMGRFIADNLVKGTDVSKIWDELFRRVENYRIVD